MKVTKYLCKIIKGKFKGVEGYTFDYPIYPNSLMVSMFGNDGNEYWIKTEDVKFIGMEELEFTEKELQDAIDRIHQKSMQEKVRKKNEDSN